MCFCEAWQVVPSLISEVAQRVEKWSWTIGSGNRIVWLSRFPWNNNPGGAPSFRAVAQVDGRGEDLGYKLCKLLPPTFPLKCRKAVLIFRLADVAPCFSRHVLMESGWKHPTEPFVFIPYRVGQHISISPRYSSLWVKWYPLPHFLSPIRSTAPCTTPLKSASNDLPIFLAEESNGEYRGSSRQLDLPRHW